MRACSVQAVRRGDGVGGVLRGTPSARRPACLPALPALPPRLRLPRPPLPDSPRLGGSGFAARGSASPAFPPVSSPGLRGGEVPRYCATRTWHRGCERAGALSQGFAGGGCLLIAVCAEGESASPGREPGHYLLIGAGEWQREDSSSSPRRVPPPRLLHHSNE